MKTIGLMISLVAGDAMGQGFNIDFGPTGQSTPSSSFGGVAAQPGFWNSTFGFASDITGTSTSTIVSVFGTGFRSQTIPGASGDDALLMEDMFKSGSSPDSVPVGVGPLAIGQYKVYVYGWAGQIQWYSGISHNRNGIFHARDNSSGIVTDFQLNYTDVWPGHQVLGETYFTFDLNVTQPNAGFSIGLQGQGSELLPRPTVCNGIQIVPVPAPGAAAVFGAALLGVGRRRR